MIRLAPAVAAAMFSALAVPAAATGTGVHPSAVSAGPVGTTPLALEAPDGDPMPAATQTDQTNESTNRRTDGGSTNGTMAEPTSEGPASGDKAAETHVVDR